MGKCLHNSPVNMELRLGQHIGVVTNAFSKKAPSSRSSRRNLGIKFNEPNRDHLEKKITLYSDLIQYLDRLS